MNTIENATEMKERKAKLSYFWIFLMFNYLYCDLLGLHDPTYLKTILGGSAGSIQLNEEFLLGASILMEIPMIMVLLSRLLSYKVNRWANIIAGTIMALIQISSMFYGTPPTLYYLFFSIIEVACNILIVGYALKWKISEKGAVL